MNSTQNSTLVGANVLTQVGDISPAPTQQKKNDPPLAPAPSPPSVGLRNAGATAAAAMPTLPTELWDKISVELANDGSKASLPALVALSRTSTTRNAAFAHNLSNRDFPDALGKNIDGMQKHHARLHARWEKRLDANTSFAGLRAERNAKNAEAGEQLRAAFVQNNAKFRLVRKPMAELLKPFANANALTIDFSVIPKKNWREVMTLIGQFKGPIELNVVARGIDSAVFRKNLLPALEAGFEAVRDTRWHNNVDGVTGMALECTNSMLAKDDFETLGKFLAKNPYVNRLDLSNSRVPPGAAGQLLMQFDATKLKELRLAGCGLGKSNMAVSDMALVFPLYTSRLSVLDLSNNNLKDSFLDKLAEKLYSTSRASRIKLDGNQFTDAGLGKLLPAIIKAQHSLDHISLKSNHFSAAAVASARQQLEAADTVGGTEMADFDSQRASAPAGKRSMPDPH